MDAKLKCHQMIDYLMHVNVRLDACNRLHTTCWIIRDKQAKQHG